MVPLGSECRQPRVSPVGIKRLSRGEAEHVGFVRAFRLQGLARADLDDLRTVIAHDFESLLFEGSKLGAFTRMCP